MPYAIRKSDLKFRVVNTETNKVKGTHSSRDKAERQLRLLRGIEKGWRPTKGGKK